jgi:hypothetical protein
MSHQKQPQMEPQKQPMNSNDPDPRVEVITPEKAAQMLQKQRNPRKLKSHGVQRYITGLKAGWKVNGETIKFDVDGYLIDGQHRLEACVRTGIPFKTIVVRGLENCDMVDSGLRRTAADILGGRGTKYAELAAAMARIVFLIEQDRDPWKTSDNPPYSDLLAFWDSHLDEQAATEAASIGRSCKLMTGSVVAAFAYYAILRHGVERVATFVSGIELGANLSQGTPKYELRRWVEARRAQKLNGHVLRRALYIALARAWRLELEESKQIHPTVIWSKIHDTEIPDIQ